MLIILLRLRHPCMQSLYAYTLEFQQQFSLKAVSSLDTHTSILSQVSKHILFLKEVRLYGVHKVPRFTWSAEQTRARWLAWLYPLLGVEMVLPAPPSSQRGIGAGVQTWHSLQLLMLLSMKEIAEDPEGGILPSRNPGSPKALLSGKFEPPVTPTPWQGAVLMFNHQPGAECCWGVRASPPRGTHESRPRPTHRGKQEEAHTVTAPGFQHLSRPSSGKFHHGGKVGILKSPTWEGGKSFFFSFPPLAS